MTSNTDNASPPSSGMDPVTFEVIRNAVVNLTEEMAVTVRRAAFSTNIKTRADFSCAFFDAKLRCVAQSFAQPAHLVAMSTITPVSIREFGADNLNAGDAIVVNDPHRGASHLNDITIISPVELNFFIHLFHHHRHHHLFLLLLYEKVLSHKGDSRKKMFWYFLL